MRIQLHKTLLDSIGMFIPFCLLCYILVWLVNSILLDWLYNIILNSSQLFSIWFGLEESSAKTLPVICPEKGNICQIKFDVHFFKSKIPPSVFSQPPLGRKPKYIMMPSYSIITLRTQLSLLAAALWRGHGTGGGGLE